MKKDNLEPVPSNTHYSVPSNRHYSMPSNRHWPSYDSLGFFHRHVLFSAEKFSQRNDVSFLYQFAFMFRFSQFRNLMKEKRKTAHTKICTYIFVSAQRFIILLLGSLTVVCGRSYETTRTYKKF